MRTDNYLSDEWVSFSCLALVAAVSVIFTITGLLACS